MKQNFFYLKYMCTHRYPFQKLFGRPHNDSIDGKNYESENTKLGSLAEHCQAVDLISDVGCSLAGPGQNGNRQRAI